MSSTLPIPPGIRPGLEATVEKVVPHEWTIAHFRSHLPPVLSTPAMIAMMEVAAAKAIEPLLAPGSISVGTRIEVDHLKAVPAGASVTAWARLEKIDGRFLAFEVEARSGDTLIGKGRVFRAIVQPGNFAPKAS
jgi:predicted thioesterase